MNVPSDSMEKMLSDEKMFRPHGQKAIRRCARCIQTDTFPHISFDAEGVCSVCRSFEKRYDPKRQFIPEDRLMAYVEKARKRNPKWQALVGLSGGKDSSYALHTMVTRFNANVLAYTFDNEFLADGARQNIEILTKALGVEHRYVKPEPGLAGRIQQALIKNRCSDFCMACANGAISSANYLAMSENVPLIVFGFSNKTEPLMPLELVCMLDFRYFADAVRPYVRKSEMRPYKYVDLHWMFYTLFIKRIRHVMLPDYVPWNDADMAAILSRTYGWKDYGEGKAHFDCRIVNAVSYFMNRRFGTNIVVEKLSQMVRYGLLTRDEAMERLCIQDDTERPEECIRCICEAAGVEERDLDPYERGETRDYHHFRSYSYWFRKFNWVFWLMYKLGISSDSIYYKYR